MEKYACNCKSEFKFFDNSAAEQLNYNILLWKYYVKQELQWKTFLAQKEIVLQAISQQKQLWRNKQLAQFSKISREINL